MYPNTAAPPAADTTAVTAADNSELDLDMSKMSISDQVTEQEVASAPVNIEQVSELITKDPFNLFSVSFLCKSKDLSERRIRLDFGLVAEVRS